MKLKSLVEEFIANFNIQGQNIEVYAFPVSNKELASVSEVYNGVRSVRFIASSLMKKIYIFSPEVMHYDVFKRLTKDAEINKSNALWGVAVYREGKWVVDRMDTPYPSEHIQKLDWSWADKWIEITDFIKNPEDRYGPKTNIKRVDYYK